MLTETSKAVDTVACAVSRAGETQGRARAGGVFKMECLDSEGNLKWVEEFPNLVVNEGLQDMNDQYFSGAGYTAAWYLGLVQGPASGTTFNAGDTLATHAGWTEDTAYTGDRKAVTFGSATSADPSVISNSASPAQFTMNGTTTIGGAFLCTVATGTSGILFSASDFQAPGDRAVVSGDVLNVTYTFSLDAA
jgi:hypothetical protein